MRIFVAWLAAVALLVTMAVGAEFRSDRGVNGTGAFKARDLVTTFWDIPEGWSLEQDRALHDCQGYKVVKWTEMKDKHKEGMRSVLPSGAKAGTRSNIVWRTTLPHWGNNAPVVVGDKVLLMTEQGWKSPCSELVCIDVKTGKILWQRPIDHLDTLPEEEQKEAKAARAAEVKRFQEAMYWWNRCHIDNETMDWESRSDEEQLKVYAEAEAAGYAGVFGGSPKRKGKVVRQARGGNGSFRERWGFANQEKSAAKKNWQLVREKGWYRYQGWATEQLWYGLTHSSVLVEVPDNPAESTVYCVLGFGGAAAFDLDGNRKWIQWLMFEDKGLTRHMTQFDVSNICAPTLHGDTLLYFHRDAAMFYGINKNTGEIRWQTPAEWPEGKKTPLGYGGHMSPGGAPTVLTINGVPIAISTSGMIVRVSDGKRLGRIAEQYNSHASWVGRGDIIYVPWGKGKNKSTGTKSVRAVRLGLDGDTITQEILWEAGVSPKDRHMVLRGDELWVQGGIVNAGTGEVLTKGGGLSLNVVMPHSDQHRVGKDDVGPFKSKGRLADMFAYRIQGLTREAGRGKGLLVEPKPEGEILERHIKQWGIPDIEFGNAAGSCWGNRIFIRSSDYLWCVGDPNTAWLSPDQMERSAQ